MKPKLDYKDNDKIKLKILQTFLIGLGFTSCQFAWGMYNFYLPRVLAGYIVDGSFFRVGFFTGSNRLLLQNTIMVLDNIVAILLQPYFGKLSDKMESKLGRRTPFILVGITISALCLLIMPFTIMLPSYWGIIISFIGIVVVFNTGMSFYRAPVVAVMPDLTHSQNRSMANVIINVMGGLGTILGGYVPIIVGGLVKEKVVGFTTFENQDFFAMDFGVFWSTAFIMLIILSLYLIFVREKPTGKSLWHIGENEIDIDPETLDIIPVELNTLNRIKTENKEKSLGTFKELKDVFTAREKSSAFMFLSIFFWCAASDAFGTNFSLWGPEYALLSDSTLGTINIVNSIAVFILGIPGAKLSQKKGRRWTIKLGVTSFLLSFGGIIVFQEIGRNLSFGVGLFGIYVCLALKSFGWALISIAAITITWQLAPKSKIGTYTGLYYVFKQLASVFSPLVIGFLLSLFTPILGNTGTWVLLIPFCFILSLLALWTFSHVKKGEVGDSLSDEEIEELEEKFGSDED